MAPKLAVAATRVCPRHAARPSAWRKKLGGARPLSVLLALPPPLAAVLPRDRRADHYYSRHCGWPRPRCVAGMVVGWHAPCYCRSPATAPTVTTAAFATADATAITATAIAASVAAAGSSAAITTPVATTLASATVAAALARSEERREGKSV